MHAPLEEVYELARDPRRWTTLFRDIRIVTQEEDESSVLSVVKVSVNDPEEDYTVIQTAKMPGTIRRKVSRGKVSSDTTYHFSRAKKGTLVEFKTELSVSGIYRLLNPMAEWYLAKRLLEKGHSFSWT